MTGFNTLLSSIGFQFIPIISLHILPMVIRSQFAFYRKFHLMLVEQHLYKNVITAFLAEENELNVACHRENLVVSPSFIESA